MSGDHAIFSPSAAERWMTCPGSVALSMGLPDDESPYAEEGTLAHSLFEKMMLGLSFTVADYPLEMVHHVTHAVDIAMKLIPDGTEYFVEQRLKHSGDVYGTGDLVIPEYFGTLTVADLKYGAGVPVAAVDEDGEPNKQLLLYASMASAAADDDFTQVRLVIIQPRVDADIETDIIVPIEKVIEFRAQVDAAVEAAKKPNAPLVPSKKGCKWCKAKPICPALKDRAQEALAQSAVSVPSLSPEAVANVLDKRAQAEEWFAAVYSYALKLAEAGVKIPGYELKPKRAYTRWKPGAENAAEKLYGQWLFERSIITPAQARKVLDDTSFVEEWTESTSSGMNLVPEKKNVKLLF
jgi:hypothetical protein